MVPGTGRRAGEFAALLLLAVSAGVSPPICTATPTATPTPHSVIRLGSARGFQGERVTLELTVDPHGEPFAEIYGNLLLDSDQIRVARGAAGKLDCVGNDLLTTYKVLAWPWCYHVPRLNCVSFDVPMYDRPINSAVANGAAVLRCDFEISIDTPPGRYSVQLSDVGMWTGRGAEWQPVVSEGEIVVDELPPGATPRPTRTPTATRPPTPTRTRFVTRTPVPTATPCGDNCPVLELQGGSGRPGGTVEIRAVLYTGGSSVAVFQNDIRFASPLRIRARADGTPDCDVNPDVDKPASAFFFHPPKCDPRHECSAVRSVVFSLHDLDPLADGATVYTCRVEIAAGAAPGTYVLPITEALMSDPEANESIGFGIDGEIDVVSEVESSAALDRSPAMSGCRISTAPRANPWTLLGIVGLGLALLRIRARFPAATAEALARERSEPG